MSDRLSNSSQDHSLPINSTPGARGTRPPPAQPQTPWSGTAIRQLQRGGPAPISTSGTSSRPSTTADSPSRAQRITSPLGSNSPGGVVRFTRHSPSVSLSTAVSPTSSTGPHSATASSPNQLKGLVVTQLDILLRTIKDDGGESERWQAQAAKIRRLVEENMEVYPQYFRRLLQSNAGVVFPNAFRQPADGAAAGNYQLLVQELQKLSQDPQQAVKIAEALDTSDGDVFRDLDLQGLVDHFRLSPIAKVALALSCRKAAKSELRAKGDAILTSNFSSFLSAVALKQPSSTNTNVSDDVIASIVDRLVQDPPRIWGEEQRENLKYATLGRYSDLKKRPPTSVESAIALMELLESSDGRLARQIQRAGPECTATLEACRDVLAGVPTQDIAYRPIAMALLFMAIAENGEAYDLGVFVQAIRQHRAGAKIDWADVVQGFDVNKLSVTKKQFLVMYNALLPLAREYTNFDIQNLWGGAWNAPDTQLSFVVAFLSTTPDELDVSQIPNLRQSFTLDDFQGASASVREFAEKAVKHPLVSMDATAALFTMIFQSQESYNRAQQMSIPETLINPNMTTFVCAAAAVPKPWGQLQDQALKQLFFPFLLKQHENYDFVMNALWRIEKQWVATRMVEFYTQDNNLISIIYEHAMEHGWLEVLLTIQSTFVLELAMYAHGKGTCDLDDFAQQHVSNMGVPAFASAIVNFLRNKIEYESIVQRPLEVNEDGSPAQPPAPMPSIQLKSVHKLLSMIQDVISEEELIPTVRLAIQPYPRLINFGEDEKLDAIILANNASGNTLPHDVVAQMEEQYKKMYGNGVDANDVIEELKRLKQSSDPANQDLFVGMIHGLFDEYNCFGEYPNEALATTAVLFGGLIKYEVLSGFSLRIALQMVFDAVTLYTNEDSMWKFGMQALLHFMDRFSDWPELAQRVLLIDSLADTQVSAAAERVMAELRQDIGSMNGDAVNGLPNGTLDEDFPVDAPISNFTSIGVDQPHRQDIYETPDDDVSDKVIFVLNNMSKRNLEEKFKDLQGALEQRHHPWFAHYLVEELAKSQPNYQALYLQLLENFDQKALWTEVLRETYLSCAKMLNAQTTMDSPQERTSLKSLAGWLGSLTLARNLPILHRNLSVKDLLLEAYDSQRLIIAIPFTCKVLVHAAKSSIFQPPNPWLMELLGFLAELYYMPELKLNQKFEIEVLCKELSLDINKITPLDVISSRPPLHEMNMLQQYVPEGGPDGFGEMHLMGLSKRAASERFTPEAVIAALPDLGNVLQIPQAAGNVTQPQLRTIFINAAQQAIYEIIAPVVERSVTIAAIATAELIQKDFAVESDVEKLRTAAHTMGRSLSGSLALVTCKEPLRMSIMNNIRMLASTSLPVQLPEGQILMFVNDNIDTVCSLVEQAAEEHSLSEADAQLQQAVEIRRHHNEQRPNEPYNNPPITRWSQLIPEPFSQQLGGLNEQQYGIYQDFGRVKGTAVASAQAISSGVADASRQLENIVSDTSYLSNLQTPADMHAVPRAVPQQRMQQLAAQGPAGQHGMNGYAESIGQTIRNMLDNLQQACREASEQHISEIASDSTVRRLFEQLVNVIDVTPGKEDLIIATAQEILGRVYHFPGKRLETEVLVRFLTSLCRMSVHTMRYITSHLAMQEDDRIFNAPVTVVMVSERLMDVDQIDMLTAKALRQKRVAALPFLSEFVSEVILGNSTVRAFRSDFTQSYEALSDWLAQEPDLVAGREIMSKLQLPTDQPNGLPSPPLSEKQDQLEYIFEEWIHLQRKRSPQRATIAFAQQLHAQHILDTEDEAIKFFRCCIELATNAHERALSLPFPTSDGPYLQVDALAQLIAVLVVQQSSDDSERAPPTRLFASIMRLIFMVFASEYAKLQERFPARVYFRLFSSLLCSMHDIRHRLSDSERAEILSSFAMTFEALQPKHFEGFAFSWLTLVSQRLFLPMMLQPSGRRTGTWDAFLRILGALFRFFGLAANEGESNGSLRMLYPGICRLMLMLHRDYPEFLIENHAVLNAMIPERVSQLHNLVNSAATQVVMSEQPDPFERGLKINRLDQVRQLPAVHTDHAKILQDARLSTHLEKALEGSDVDVRTILAFVDRPTKPIDTHTINVLILHLAVVATKASTVFSAASPPARLLDRLLTLSRPELRFHLLCALTNQLRYVNGHTQYFSTAMVHFFSAGSEDLRQAMLGVFVNRLSMARPHPWGLLVTMLEVIKNPSYDVWGMPWVKAHGQVENMLMTLVQHQERVGSA
nr:hypothetical protein B0A51_13367 [Rachicladosporium sp. CCFEE 5018]